jgi:hypothetical protein
MRYQRLAGEKLASQLPLFGVIHMHGTLAEGTRTNKNDRRRSSLLQATADNWLGEKAWVAVVRARATSHGKVNICIGARRAPSGLPGMPANARPRALPNERGSAPAAVSGRHEREARGWG